MIPRIANLTRVDARYQKFLQALAEAGFSGEIESRYAARLLCATDNSVYQRMPQAVVFPKDKYDVAKVFTLAKRIEYRDLVFVARGGGTGTNGQSLTSGLVIDMSRHMKGVSDLNPLERTVFVQPGVIKDELNEQIAEYNLFFSPELSTSSRATIGGMISNDAAGQGSLKYGRTSEHILETEVVLMDGTITTFKAVSGDELKACLEKPGLEGDIYRQCYALLKEKNPEVKKVFPKLNRFMTGYDMDHAYDAKTDTLNLARLICGAEGTLCTLVGAKLDLTLKPVFRALCVIKYEDFISALRHANILIHAGVFSVETVDSKVLNLAKNDPVWLDVHEYIQEVPNAEIAGINIVEFNGYDAEQEEKFMEKLFKQVAKQAKTKESGILGVQKVTTKQGITAVYGMRKKAVGLLGSAAGSKKLVAFTEDTVVPPENLADYIVEFRALLDSMHVPYGMFGHVDTGLMHVRPALDLTDPTEKEKLVTISYGVVELVKKYGGQMWGEHGRGYRACFGEVFFGELYESARKIKAFFDAKNRLNPGKICVPYGNEQDKLVSIDAVMRGDIDRSIHINTRQSFAGALNCNGNGQCFSYSKASLMCPSYRYSKDHVKSPKGYSGLMREWLRLMTERGVDITEEEAGLLPGTRPFGSTSSAPIAERGLISSGFHYCTSWFGRARNTLFDRDDFNHEYLKQLSTCLSCKSCKTQCPAHVNAADLNSRFLNFYYTRYLRPSMDLLCLNAEQAIPLLARMPKVMNYVQGMGLSRYLLAKIFKFVDLPKFAEKTLAQQARENHIPLLDYKTALTRAAHYDVIIVTDIFTASYDTEGLLDLATLAKNLGFRVGFLKPYINGKLAVIRGARGQFIRHARVQADRLSKLEGMGLTLIGFDPALTICYRDEYPALVPNCPSFKVLLPEEWLQQALKSQNFARRKEKLEAAITRYLANPVHLPEETLEGAIPASDYAKEYFLLCHCTEQALVPLSVKMWQQVMAAFHLKLTVIPVACCGMAGLFGHMLGNQDESQKVYEMNWQKHIHDHDFAQCLITGFSCRSQVYRMEGQKANHPIHVMSNLIEKALAEN